VSRIRIRIGGANSASEDDVRPPRRPNGNVAFRVRGRGKVEDGASFFVVVCIGSLSLFLFLRTSHVARRMRVFVGDVFRCCVVLKEKRLMY
jgi:hypothetical protein